MTVFILNEVLDEEDSYKGVFSSLERAQEEAKSFNVNNDCRRFVIVEDELDSLGPCVRVLEIQFGRESGPEWSEVWNRDAEPHPKEVKP